MKRSSKYEKPLAICFALLTVCMSALAICVLLGSKNSSQTQYVSTPAPISTPNQTVVPSVAVTPAPSEETVALTENITFGEKNALKKAESYLSFMAFSYTGLIEQLEFEKFTHAEAVYAVDHCGADWYEQAYKKAQSYLELMAFSRDGLIEQLEFEGFTNEEAEYAANKVGY